MVFITKHLIDIVSICEMKLKLIVFAFNQSNLSLFKMSIVMMDKITNNLNGDVCKVFVLQNDYNNCAALFIAWIYVFY